MAATACDLTRRSANEVDRGRGRAVVGGRWRLAAAGKTRLRFPPDRDNDTLPDLLPREQSMRILSVLVGTAALFAVNAELKALGETP
jgi:hypothetical protein